MKPETTLSEKQLELITRKVYNRVMFGTDDEEKLKDYFIERHKEDTKWFKLFLVLAGTFGFLVLLFILHDSFVMWARG